MKFLILIILIFYLDKSNFEKSCKLFKENNGIHLSCNSLYKTPNSSYLNLGNILGNNMITYKPIDRHEILNSKSLQNTLNFYKQLPSFQIPMIIYINLNGFDINLFHDINNTEFYDINIYFSSLKFNLYFSNGTLVQKCPTTWNPIEKSQFKINFFQLYKFTLYPRKICPFFFQNIDIKLLMLYYQTNTFYKKNFLNFETIPDSIDLNTNIRSLNLLFTHNLRLGTNILNRNVFKNILFMSVDGKLESIDDNLFSYFNSLKIIVFDLYHAKNLFHKGLDWTYSINKDIQVDLDNTTQVNEYFNFKTLILIKDLNEYSDSTFTMLNLFPDEDFCLYKKFPFNKMIYLVVLEGSEHFKSSCTFNFIRQQNSKISFDYPNFFANSFLHNISEISHCNFTKLSLLCEKEQIYADSFEIENFYETSMLIDFLILIILDPIFSLLGLLINLFTFIFFKAEALNKNQYNFIRFYSALCCFYFVISLTNLITECQLPNGIYCSNIHKLIHVQYFRKIFTDTIQFFLKVCLNFVIIGFNYFQYRIVQNSKVLNQGRILNFWIYIKVVGIIGFILSFPNYFYTVINRESPFQNYPFSVLENDVQIELYIKYLNKVVIIVYIVNEFLNYFIMKRDKVKCMKTSQLKSLKTTLFNSILNFFLKLPELFLVINALAHYYGGFSNGINSKWDLLFKLICSVYNFNNVVGHLCKFLYTISLLTNYYFYFVLDKNFRSFIQDFSQKKNEKPSTHQIRK
ncbi:unnamed protein product [Brachionus calyciflorus]|uniref:G-protein coupled receptors family 1 profile domain-containing protein n=1 Tax=Brachionus calyciflorus TaxID=104777 RepID=A0A813TPZ4_9BILA|nr:unnamed protein product [Brachionus calyciflorus]